MDGHDGSSMVVSPNNLTSMDRVGGQVGQSGTIHIKTDGNWLAVVGTGDTANIFEVFVDVDTDRDIFKIRLNLKGDETVE